MLDNIVNIPLCKNNNIINKKTNNNNSGTIYLFD